MNDFLNSKSMTTPGVAGGLVMVIANSLALRFDFGSYMAHTVLFLSFLTGLIVFNDSLVKWPIRIILYILNSLIIFSIAAGTNAIGEKVSMNAEKKIDPIVKPIEISLDENSNSNFLFVQNVDSSKIRKVVLAKQVNATSQIIQSIQDQLIDKQKLYKQPEQKLKVLIDINKVLLSVANDLKTTDTLSLSKNERADSVLYEVQHNLSVLQGAMLFEEKSISSQKKFFKSWF